MKNNAYIKRVQLCTIHVCYVVFLRVSCFEVIKGKGKGKSRSLTCQWKHRTHSRGVAVLILNPAARRSRMFKAKTRPILSRVGDNLPIVQKDIWVAGRYRRVRIKRISCPQLGSNYVIPAPF